MSSGNPFTNLISATGAPAPPPSPPSLQARVQAAPADSIASPAPAHEGILSYLKNPWVIGIGSVVFLILCYLIYQHFYGGYKD
jgi:hypothetical protein